MQENAEYLRILLEKWISNKSKEKENSKDRYDSFILW